MNNARRKQLRTILERLNECLGELETVRDEEQEAFDNMPEGLQASEKGERASTAISELDDAFAYLENVTGHIETAIEEC